MQFVIYCMQIHITAYADKEVPMKKLVSVLLAALLLVSCSTEAPSDTDPQNAGTNSPQTHPMEDFEVTRIDNYLSTSLNETAQIAEFRDQEQCGFWTTAPMVQIVGDKTYVMRRFPEEIIGMDPVGYFFAGDEAKKHSNQVEIYTGGNYDTPAELITFTGHSDRMHRFDAFEYLPDTDTFITLELYYTIDAEKVFTIRTFDGDGRFLSEEDIAPPNLDRNDYPFIDLCFMGGDLYYMKQGTTVYRYDFDTDTEILVNGSINGFTVSDGKLVYIRHAENDDFETEFRVCEYDPAQDRSIVLGKLACNPEEQRITKDTRILPAYDRENKILYYYSAAGSVNLPFGIRAARLDGDTYEQVLATTQTGQYIKQLQIYGDTLLLQVGNNQVLLYEVPETPIPYNLDMQTLNFCLYDMHLTTLTNYEADVFSLLEMSGTMAKAGGTYLSNDPEEYAFTMAKKLMAGDTDFDIFFVNTEMSSLMKEGYYENLQQYRPLDEAVSAMIPGVKELCTIGDTFALLPLYLNTDLMQVHSHRVGGEIPAFSTFSELVDLAGQLNYANSTVKLMTGYTHLTMVLPWFEQYVSNFMASVADDEQAETDLTELYRRTSELIAGSHTAHGKTYAGYQPVFRIARNQGQSQEVPEGRAILPIVPAASGYRQSVNGQFYAINPNSPNKELAAQFLLCRLAMIRSGNLTGTRDEMMTYPEGSELGEALYRQQIQDGVLAWNVPDLRERVGKHLTAIASGTVTPEDAADELFRYLKMVKYE